MKKYNMVMITLLLAILMTACSQEPAETIPLENESSDSAALTTEEATEPDPLTTEVVDEGLTFTQIENTVSEDYIHYAESYGLIANLENPKIRTHINQSIETVINKSKNSTMQIERSLYDAASGSPLQMEVIGKPIFFDEQILSYQIIFKSTTSESQENIRYTFLNFDLNSGQLIKLKDLIPIDTLYAQIEKAYPKTYETPFNKDSLNYFDINHSFRFSGENSAVFVIEPHQLTYEQTQFIQIPISDFHYDANKKLIVGSTVQSIERVESNDSYEIFFSYPEFDSTLPIYENINEEVVKHAADLYEYGTQMAIVDHQILTEEANTSENTDDSVESESITPTDSEPETDNASLYELSPYWFNLTYEIYTNNEKILSFGLYDYQYTGGAHGMSTGNFFSYDLETGKQIELKDLFEPKFDYITYINDRIYRKIDQETKLNAESTYAYYDFNGIDENVKFYIEDNELVIFFDQYEIAAYAAGMPTFRIPLP